MEDFYLNSYTRPYQLNLYATLSAKAEGYTRPYQLNLYATLSAKAEGYTRPYQLNLYATLSAKRKSCTRPYQLTGSKSGLSWAKGVLRTPALAFVLIRM
jgi:hypothetical protein